MSLVIRKDRSLKELNTFGIEASARFFVEIASEDEAMNALSYANEKNLPVFVLGGGSNILISDKGFDGLVIHNKILGIEAKADGTVISGGGESWDEVVRTAVERNLAGIECLSGVPGSAGGAVVQNVGAYGQTLGDVVFEVRAVEITTGKQKVFSPAECEFAYRSSWFKKNPNKYIVTSFSIALKENGEPNVTYQDVKKYFEGRQPSLVEVRKAIIEIRASKGYVIMPGYECYKTAGSFFKNPILSKDKFQDLKSEIKATDQWFWEMPGDKVKVAAAKVMQEAGFGKGYVAGKVGISPKHSLSLINLGNAKASEVEALANEIEQQVFEKYGVKLEEEVLFVGDGIYRQSGEEADKIKI